MAELTTSLLGLAVALFVIASMWFVHRFMFSARKSADPEPPGPWGLPIIGYLPFLGRKMNVTLTNLSKKYGDVFQVKLGARKVVVVNGQRAIRDGLVNRQQTEFAGRPDFFTYEIVPNFGFCTYSENFRIHKKCTLKAFGSFAKERRSELLQVGHKAVRMLLKAAEAKNGEPFYPKGDLFKATCIIMGYICYGEMFDGDSPQVQTILSRDKEFGDGVAAGVICNYLPWVKPLIKGKLQRFKGLLKHINDYSNQLISAHLETYDGENIRDMSDMFHKVSEDTELKVNREMLQNTVSTILGAGFGTVSSTLMYSFMIMALHRDVQRKVHEEIDRIIGKSRLPDFDDINDLPYTHAVIIENYRRHSMSALGVIHSAMKDTKLDGYHIAKDTPVVFNYYSAHRDPSVFKDPYSYNPDRFLTPSGQIDQTAVNNVIPFGLGMRRCAGEVIARLEVNIFFITMMQRCVIEESPEHPLDLEDYIMTLGLSLNPFKVIVKPRYEGAFDT